MYHKRLYVRLYCAHIPVSGLQLYGTRLWCYKCRVVSALIKDAHYIKRTLIKCIFYSEPLSNVGQVVCIGGVAINQPTRFTPHYRVIWLDLMAQVHGSSELYGSTIHLNPLRNISYPNRLHSISPSSQLLQWHHYTVLWLSILDIQWQRVFNTLEPMQFVTKPQIWNTAHTFVHQLYSTYQ